MSAEPARSLFHHNDAVTHAAGLTQRWHMTGTPGGMSLPDWLGLHPGEYDAVRSGGRLPLRWQVHPPFPAAGWLTVSEQLSEHRWDEIVAGLWVGGFDIGRSGPNLEMFDLVVTADASVVTVDPVAEGREIRCLFNDASAPADDGPLAAAVTQAAAVWQIGGRVLVRCAAGQNRSAWLTARLLQMCGWPAAHALHRLREARGPATLENPSFVAALRACPLPGR